MSECTSMCEQCGKEFETAFGKYCSNSCKQAAYRKRNAQPVTPMTVTAEQARNICAEGERENPGCVIDFVGTPAGPGRQRIGRAESLTRDANG